jgi:hypothetical protein
MFVKELKQEDLENCLHLLSVLSSLGIKNLTWRETVVIASVQHRMAV